MKSRYESLKRGLLTLIICIALAVTLMGCSDPNAVNIETEHQRLTEIARQDIQLMHSMNASVFGQQDAYYPGQ